MKIQQIYYVSFFMMLVFSEFVCASEAVRQNGLSLRGRRSPDTRETLVDRARDRRNNIDENTVEGNVQIYNSTSNKKNRIVLRRCMLNR